MFLTPLSPTNYSILSGLRINRPFHPPGFTRGYCLLNPFRVFPTSGKSQTQSILSVSPISTLNSNSIFLLIQMARSIHPLPFSFSLSPFSFFLFPFFFSLIPPSPPQPYILPFLPGTGNRFEAIFLPSIETDCTPLLTPPALVTWIW